MKSTAKKKLGRGESQKGEDRRWRRSEMEKVRREKMQVTTFGSCDVEKVHAVVVRSTCPSNKGPDNPTCVALRVRKAGV